MKKSAVILILLFVSAFNLNAVFTAENDPAPKVQPVYRAMTIGGDLNATVSVSVNPIVADISAAEGTPFNMLGDDVLQSSGYVGRKIADWMLFSNTNRANMTVTAQPLTGPLPDGDSKVPYVLYFHYSFATYDTQTGKYIGDISGESYVVSDGYTGEVFSDDSGIKAAENGLIEISSDIRQKININNGEIRVFIPTSAIAGVRDNDKTPPGTYEASVVITVESFE